MGRAGVRAVVLGWAHLLLGGAVLMPPFLLSGVVVIVLWRSEVTTVGGQAAAYALSLPLIAVVGLFAAVRPLSAAAAQMLLGVAPERLAGAPSSSWAARRRTAGWLVTHTAVGALVSGVSLSVPPAAVLLLVLPFRPPPDTESWPWAGPFVSAPGWLAPLTGIALLVALVTLAILAGKLLRGVAPALLGPTPADRLLEAERRAARLAESNRIARELHDSVGHALSAVTLQASAARRVLDRDPEFARGAMVAIEETSRRAVEELDAVLGVLRDGEAADVASPDLGALDPLLRSTRAAGVDVTLRADPGLDRLPKAISQEAYRIVQEALSNVLRHAGAVPTSLELSMGEEELTIVVDNELPDPDRRGRPTGGRGLTGVIERATLLGGSAEAAPHEDGWRLSARLPLRDAR